MIEILEAMQKRIILKFKYKDETNFRSVDVYVLGVTSNGEAMIRAYQINDGWKLFKVLLMRDLELTELKCYGYKSGFNKEDKAFKKIVKSVS